MGRASDPLRQFRKTLENGHLGEAMRMAKGLPVSDYDALRLTMLAAVHRAPVYDAMAGRWIARVASKRRLNLQQVGWLVQRFEEAKCGQGRPAERALVRFLGDEWDLPH